MRQTNYPSINHQSFKISTKGVKKRYSKISHYFIGSVLGKGGFATVYKAIQTYTGKQVAVKVANLEALSSSQVNQIRNQVSIHKNLNHPNISRIYEVIWTQTKVYIFMEYIKGTELFQYIKKHGPIQQNIAAKIFSQIISALMYLHQNRIAHRDIKAQNIIIDSDFNAKLIDFGLAKKFKIINSKDQLFKTFCGSISYACPQLLKKNYSGRMVDIWCLGITLYVMLEAVMPFDQPNNLNIEQKIRNFNWNPSNRSSLEAKQIYHSIFTFARGRASLEDIVNSKFLEKYYLNVRLNIPSFKEQKYIYQSQINEINNQSILQIASLLNDRQNQVLISVKNKKLNTAYCLYQLWPHKKSTGRNDTQTFQFPKKHKDFNSPDYNQRQAMTSKARKHSLRLDDFTFLQKPAENQLGAFQLDRRQASLNKQIKAKSFKQELGNFEIFPKQQILIRRKFQPRKLLSSLEE